MHILIFFLFLFNLSGMRGTSRSLWAGSPEQERRYQPNTPWDTLLRSAALPVRPTWRRKSWLPTPSWRWGMEAVSFICFLLILQCHILKYQLINILKAFCEHLFIILLSRCRISLDLQIFATEFVKSFNASRVMKLCSIAVNVSSKCKSCVIFPGSLWIDPCFFGLITPLYIHLVDL